ncbi:MAG TPA: hypothetical protein VGO04_24565 [Ensifer sp.]|jgi:hypothetical protein|uniref:hypothetical protein n=1 Tax=Ensifer sp. TaxID=1872086 RepID=UPI002E14D33D|nr:hypothetical protein [Ensifer sp.]
MPEGLQLDENRRFQERFWQAERWAWGFFALIVMAGLLGLTGAGGPFARSQASAGASQIDYPRVARWQAADRITISFAPHAATERKLLLSRRFRELISLQDAQPHPVRWESTAAGEELTFLVRPNEAASATLRIKPEAAGMIESIVSVDGIAANTVILVLP